MTSEIVLMTYCVFLRHGVFSEELIRTGMLPKSSFHKLCVTSKRNNSFLFTLLLFS